MEEVCVRCNKKVTVHTIQKFETSDVLGDELIGTTNQVLICDECGNEIAYEPYDRQTLQKVYDIYKLLHGLPVTTTMQEVKELKSKNKLTKVYER